MSYRKKYVSIKVISTKKKKSHRVYAHSIPLPVQNNKKFLLV